MVQVTKAPKYIPKDRLLKAKEVCERIGFAIQTLYNSSVSEKCLPGFPRPIRIGPRAIRWSENEVEEYIVNRRT
jgi:predicted DNA-binding transcriptional regulator AlpA